MPHKTLVNLLEWQNRQSEADEFWRTLQFSSLGFDVSFQEQFSTWSTGGILVLISDEELAARKETWAAPDFKAARGTLHKYIKNVKSASEGCVTDE